MTDPISFYNRAYALLRSLYHIGETTREGPIVADLEAKHLYSALLRFTTKHENEPAIPLAVFEKYYGPLPLDEEQRTNLAGTDQYLTVSELNGTMEKEEIAFSQRPLPTLNRPCSTEELVRTALLRFFPFRERRKLYAESPLPLNAMELQRLLTFDFHPVLEGGLLTYATTVDLFQDRKKTDFIFNLYAKQMAWGEFLAIPRKEGSAGEPAPIMIAEIESRLRTKGIPTDLVLRVIKTRLATEDSHQTILVDLICDPTHSK